MLDDIKNLIEGVTDDDIRLFFITRKKKKDQIEYGVLKTDITSNVGQIMKTISLSNIDAFLEQDDLSYFDYNPGVILEGSTIEKISKDEIQHLQDILQQMDNADIDQFSMEHTKHLWAYAIKISDKNILLFRKYTENRILDKKGWKALFIGDDGCFNQAKDSILTIDEKIDCILYDDSVFILNDVQFEQIFSFMDKFIEEIDQNIKNIESRNILDDTSGLWDICKTDPKKVKKLNKILCGNILQSLNSIKIKTLNSDWNLNLNFTSDGKIILDKGNIWNILKVLDDDYLESPVTDNKYEVHSKVKK